MQTNPTRVTGIQGKWEQDRERKTGTEIFLNPYYSSDPSPVRFTELYRPNHLYAIIVKCTRPYQISALAIQYID